jgi:hypothetical protein
MQRQDDRINSSLQNLKEVTILIKTFPSTISVARNKLNESDWARERGQNTSIFLRFRLFLFSDGAVWRRKPERLSEQK